MKIINKQFEKLEDFLVCYFHEDISNLQEGLDEFLSKSNTTRVYEVNKVLNEFFENTDIGIKEKNQFIIDSIRLKLPEKYSTHLDWLKDVALQIEKHLENK